MHEINRLAPLRWWLHGAAMLALSVCLYSTVASDYADLNMPKGFVKKLHDVHGSHETIVGYMANEKAKSMLKAKLNYGGLQLK